MKNFDNKRNHISNLLIITTGLLSTCIGCISLIGWIFGIPLLTSYSYDFIPMAPSTALLFVIFGLSVSLGIWAPFKKEVCRICVAFSLFGTLIAILIFILSSLGIHSNIEYIGITITGEIAGVPIGHMSPLTAFCFVLSGLSLLFSLLLFSRKTKLAIVAFIFASIVMSISFVLLLAYLLGSPLLYGGNIIPPALSTILAFQFLGIALLILTALRILPQDISFEKLITRSSYTLILVFVILAAGIITSGYFYYRNYEKTRRIEIEHRLSAIADLKVDEIVQWRKERLGDASVFYKNINFSELVKRLVESPNKAKAKSQILVWLKQVRDAHQYSRLCLHDNKGNERLIFPDESGGSHSSTFYKNIAEVKKSGKIVFADFYRNEHDKQIYLNIFIPILETGNNNNIVGILAMRIDPKQYLYPLINKWPTPSKTAETLIIRRDGDYALFLNELRFKKNTALNLRSPLTEKQMPAVKAALGQEGIVEGYDYRHIDVVASVRAIPNSPWFLVARMDLSEIYEPLRERFWVIIFLIVSLLASAGFGVGLVWRQQRVRFYEDKYKSTESIRRLNRVYAVLSDINQAIVRIREQQELYEKVCDIAVEKGGFQMAWIGKINPQTKKVDVVASKGVQESHLKKIDFNYDDDENQLGIAGRAIKTGAHVVSNDIQKDESILQTHKESVMYGAKSSAAFPIKVYGKVWGVFKLYSSEIGFFDEDELKLLDELAMDISFSIEFAEKEAERKRAEVQLHNSEERFRSTLDNMLEGCQIIGNDWRYIYLNDTADMHNRRPKEELLGNRYMDMWPGIENTEVFRIIKHCKEERVPHHLENEFVFPDGTRGWYDLSIQPVPEGVFILSLDITNRKQAEENEKLANDVLQHLNVDRDTESMISSIIQLIKKSTEYEAIGIRIKEGDDFPYFQATGFSDNFIKTENNLCSYDKDGNPICGNDGKPLLECMCGNILYGRVDPAKSFFTEGGSFRSNNTTQLLATTTDEDRKARTRNRCNSAGYESVALIPLRSGNEIIGLLQLNDHRKNMFTSDIIPFFESLGSSIGIALMRNKAEKEIRELNIELEQRVKNRTEQLEAANKELEAFSYSVSHDLRSPLRAIDGFSRILSEEYCDEIDSEGKRLLSIVRASTQKMDQLITDMLSLSRVSRSEMNFHRVDMAKMANSIYHEVTTDEIRNKFVFLVQPLPEVFADTTLIRQVWINIISNAIKYTMPKEIRKIEIGSYSENGMDIFYAKDSGVGFNPDYVHKLFGVFQRLHTEKEFEGTGVGLAIVQRIIHRHNGKVWAEGTVGEGATFYFSLPKKEIKNE